MGFEGLLGNDRLKENLNNSLKKGHISHFYLISGPEGSGKHTLARLLAAAILCQGADRPCGACGPCRKVLHGAHPDFITVDDPERKTVPVDLIRRAREDIYIRPNEAEHKIYLFPRAQDMGVPGQNALLKILEEPPPYGVFLLLTDNPEKLLPTVRSRCTPLRLEPLPRPLLEGELARAFPQAAPEDLRAAADRSGGYLGRAQALLSDAGDISPQARLFLRALQQRDPSALLEALVPMEKWKREALASELDQWRALTEAALASQSGLEAPSPHARALASACPAQRLFQAAQALGKAADYTRSNVSPAAVCGWLSWELRGGS